jgi:hypothetical protein
MDHRSDGAPSVMRNISTYPRQNASRQSDVEHDQLDKSKEQQLELGKTMT